MFGSMKVGTRLGLGFLAVIIFTAVIGIVGYFNVSSISNATIRMLNTDSVIAEHAARARANIVGLRRYEKDLFLNIGSKEKEGAYITKWSDELQHLNSRIGDLEKVIEIQQEKDMLKAVKDLLRTYDSGFKKVCGMIAEGRINTPQEANAAMSDYKETMHSLESVAKELADLGNKRVDELEPVIHATRDRTLSTLLILLLVTIILSTSVAYAITVSVTRPIKSMSHMIQDIAQGEGDLTRRLDVTSRDEIGEAARWFNIFIDNVHQIISRISNSSNQIASASEELSATAEQMSKGAQTQTTRASQIASAMEEMSATVIEVAKGAQSAAHAAREATVTATTGEGVVSRTVVGMNRIADSVRGTAGTVKELGNRSDQIGEIVAVINDIADQTNLLALNAAIEAARAGEQGRGFAVVADEVRKLAERTTKATKEIEAMIKGIQKETGSAVVEMETGSEKVVEGVNLANQAGDSLRIIMSTVQQVNDLISQIATAAEQQSSAAEEITSSVVEISDITKETSTGAEQTAAASHELSRMAGDLKNIVGKFKL